MTYPTVSNKIRTKPNTLSEMYKWGMIPFHAYNKVKHLSFEDAVKELDAQGMYQTCGIHADQLIEYCINWKDYPGYYTQNEWVRHCMKLTAGRISPTTVMQVWYHFT